MTRLTTEQIDVMTAGHELDALVAEKVMGEIMPTAPHDRAHLEPIKSNGENWICWPEYEHGDKCKWAPLPFSTDLMAAWKVVVDSSLGFAVFNQPTDSFILLAAIGQITETASNIGGRKKRKSWKATRRRGRFTFI
jgi:hypothetical protein